MEKKVRFQQLRNDLFWEVWDDETQKTVRWSGYDDGYWWQNVATSEEWQTRGKYRLNPTTNIVTITIEKTA
jgi:hypothetical protein